MRAEGRTPPSSLFPPAEIRMALPRSRRQRRRLHGASHARSLAPVGRRPRRPRQSRKVSAREAAKAGLARLDAVNPKLNAVIDHRPEDVLQAGRRGRCRHRPGRGSRRAGRGARHHQGQCRPGGLCHHQRPQASARPDRARGQSGGRQFPQSGRHPARPHQLPGLLLSLVHHQPRSMATPRTRAMPR